jgi:hypothetical protein
MPQRLSDVPLASLVPETKAWQNGESVSLEGWIYALGSFEQLIAYGELFWPDFVEHDGCILRRGFTEEAYRGFLEQTGGNKQAVEAVMNHVHVVDLIHGPVDGPSEEQLVYVGRLLREMWEEKLTREFPDRKFIVHFEEEGDSVYDFVVNFHQEWVGTGSLGCVG